MRDILAELEGKEYTEGIYNDYDIRFCNDDEYDDIKSFLKIHWKENHIFCLSKEVFDFQHLDKENHRYNFVIARYKEDNAIHALLGFVPTSQFDSGIKRTMVWPCIWKNRDDIKRKGLGVSMYHYLKNHIEIETISILGISAVALSIYKHWNFSTGTIEQYVMPNFSAQDHLSSGLRDVYPSFSADTKDVFELVDLSYDDYCAIPDSSEIFGEYAQYKSKIYYVNRFIKHPVYKYQFLAIKDKGGIKAIIIARKCGDGNYYCLRIVDYIGSISYLAGIKNQMQDYLVVNDLEYVDFVEVGLDDKELNQAGFINRKDYADVIVPNYFEPFLKENIDLDYAFKTVVDDARKVFFKADADQDRPNILAH
ncbi:hypothetical protein [Butyrivibrio sp. WCD3002]|uniref:hypothetical protein n=1 Tax=Butyrivibrio sp. WCD3002 TaxID=1280676 RepID=UPI0004177D81|nr:hypothetical protein [Butyrivibrio sp. WCD3002]